MKIENSLIQLSSSHGYKEEQQELEALHVWKDEGVDPQKINLDRLEISSSSIQMYQETSLALSGSSVIDNEDQEEATDYLSSEDRLKLSMLEKMFSYLTGHEVKFQIPHLKLKKNTGNYNPQGHVSEDQRQGWGMIYHHESQYHEKETMDFQAQGIIKTADGKEIDIAVGLHMNREYYEAHQTTIKAGDALIDPLVLNFDGNAADLSQQKFEFDLDFDGTPDQISYLSSGSGYLALDANENGAIDSGKELFGPQSGHGFSELAEFDEDGNGWIDEGDRIFNQLRIWMIHEDGTNQLVGLGEKGVGAIYLGHTESLFQLKDAANDTHGQIRESGIFLNENGSVGTIQEIDLKV